MHLLKFSIEGLEPYSNRTISMDLYASDRVSKQAITVHRLTGAGSNICSQTVVGIAGLNASGKTTTLRALNFALDIARGNPLNANHPVYRPLMALASDLIRIRTIFAIGTDWYLLDSVIAKKNTKAGQGDDESGIRLSFVNEHLRKYNSKPVLKKELEDFDAFYNRSSEILTRGIGGEHELSPEAKRYIPSNTSITSGLNDDSGNVTPVMNYFDSFRIPFSTPSVPPEIVKTFDRSVERLEVDSDSKVHLKFIDDNQERIMSQFDAAQTLSAGTIRGSRIVNATIAVLREGGYFLVDEIENSLNKKLVETIMDLFASPATNPKGATLVFTTHYPELLDHLDRKDCVYFTVRDESRHIQLIKYSEGLAQAAPKKARVESKKSEIFFSNLVKGTAPKAKDVATMRHYVKSLTGADNA